MSRLLAVAARELRERWLLFPASLFFGIFNPLVLPAFGVDRQVMPLLGFVTAMGMGAAAAVLMGSTMFARDAANGRLGFLFARPLSWRSIWGGKWLAAFVLVVGSSALAAIPSMAVFPLPSLGGHHGDSWLWALAHDPSWVFALGALLLAAAITNFGATAYRSRSPWLVLDMLLAAAVVWLARQYVAPLWRYGIVSGDDGIVIALPLAVGLLAGSAAQVAIGRSDARRAHPALSIGFWSVVGPSVAAASGYWLWALSASPADVGVQSLARDPAGRWIYVEGAARRGGFYPYGFLIDTATGRWAPRPEPEPYSWRSGFPFAVRFSRDGHFVVLTSDGQGAGAILADLTASAPRGVRVSLESSPPPDWNTAFAVSASADSVIVAHESGASIFALPSGRRVATTPIAPGWRPVAARYTEEGATRTWFVPWNTSTNIAAPRAELRVLDLAADGRSTTRVLPLERALDVPAVWRAVRPDAAGRRIITFDAGARLRDGSTGAWLATLTESTSDVATSFLADGRVVVAVAQPAAGAAGRPGVILRVCDREGAGLGELPLDFPSLGLRLGPEVAPGRVVVSSIRAPFLEQRMVVVDVATGQIVERFADLSPVAGFWFGPSAAAPGEGYGSVQFLRDGAGSLLRYDFASGARTIVAGPGAARGERMPVVW